MRRLWQSHAIAFLVAIPSVVTAQQFADVLIKANDYAYLNPPTSLAPGLTAFSFVNTGSVRHEMVLVRLKPGVSVDSAMRVRNAGGPPQGTVEPANGILTAPPGVKTPGRLLVDLLPGHTYVILCFLQDAADKPHHTVLGMYTSFRVQ